VSTLYRHGSEQEGGKQMPPLTFSMSVIFPDFSIPQPHFNGVKIFNSTMKRQKPKTSFVLVL
jgi:hypothetical protein